MRRSPAHLVAVLALSVAAACGAPASPPAEQAATSPAPEGTAPSCDGEPALARVAGSERYATAAAVARQWWDAAAEVVLASGAVFPDALAAGVLAARRDAPILLTDPDRLPAVISEQLDRLRPERVTIVGGTDAVSREVEEQVEASPSRPAVGRLAGEDRFATAADVALAAGPSPSGRAVVVSGEVFADAVSAGALAATPDRVPTLLTGRDRLHPQAARALGELEPSEVLLVGGTAVLDEQVVRDLEGRGYGVTRLAGDERFETSARVVTEALDRHGDATGVLAATGGDFPDALTAAAAAARSGAVSALVPAREPLAVGPVTGALRRHADRLRCNAVVGGTAALGVLVAEQLSSVVGADPPDGPPVLVGAGDIADCDSSGDEATAALLDGIGGTVATFGDNAYDRGTAGEFARCYEPSWGRHRWRTRPATGNHDYGTDGAAGYFDYFGAAAGDPGEGWYSYDLGPHWHAVALNSNCWAVGGCAAGSPQERWLRADLEANRDRHVLAYWHHPRWSSGATHGSSEATADLVQALYDEGAELILAGHDHTYERFAPMAPDGSADAEHGVRQFVVGTGGRSLYGFDEALPTTETRSNDSFGVLVLTLRADGYDWRFVPTQDGAATDQGSDRAHGPPEGPA